MYATSTIAATATTKPMKIKAAPSRMRATDMKHGLLKAL
jgi:hypothetical protein